jgi:hypothetical protein
MTIGTSIRGIVVQGHRVASGPSRDYPYGTLEKQKPIFKARGLDLERFFEGTLNISIAPYKFEILDPEYTFQQVAWTDLHPAENFSFSKCSVAFGGRTYCGYVYYPHPETKVRHYQPNSVLEVICESIPDIQYGDKVDLHLSSKEIRILE